MSFTQVQPHDHWPSGDSRALAVIPLGLGAIADAYDIEFARNIDDLDEFSLAAFEMPNGNQAWIYKHDHDPKPDETVIYVDVQEDMPLSLEWLVGALEDEFGFSVEDFPWVAEDAVMMNAVVSVRERMVVYAG